MRKRSIVLVVSVLVGVFALTAVVVAAVVLRSAAKPPVVSAASPGPAPGLAAPQAASSTLPREPAPATTTPAGAGTTAPKTRRCASSGLSATLADTTGAAGTAYSHLVFTNTSSQPCTLAGYPGVSFVDSGGRQVGAAVPRAAGFGGVVTIGPGSSAGAVFAHRNAYVGTVAGCQATEAAGLRIYPPAETAAIFVPNPIRVCANPATDGSASITAVTDLANLPG